MFLNFLFCSGCPHTVTVTPCGPFKAGDVLTCTSDGYPEPSYTWTNSGGKVMSTGRNITLTETHQNLICTATGNFTKPCSTSTVINAVRCVTGFYELIFMN